MKELLGIRANEIGTHTERGEIIELVFLTSEAKYEISNDEALIRTREVTDFRLIISKEDVKKLALRLLEAVNETEK